MEELLAAVLPVSEAAAAVVVVTAEEDRIF